MEKGGENGRQCNGFGKEFAALLQEILQTKMGRKYAWSKWNSGARSSGMKAAGTKHSLEKSERWATGQPAWGDNKVKHRFNSNWREGSWVGPHRGRGQGRYNKVLRALWRELKVIICMYVYRSTQNGASTNIQLPELSVTGPSDSRALLCTSCRSVGKCFCNC